MIQIDQNGNYLYTYIKGENIKEIDFEENFFSLIDLENLEYKSDFNLKEIDADTIILPKDMTHLTEDFLHYAHVKNIVFPESLTLVDRSSLKDTNVPILDFSKTKLNLIAKNACCRNNLLETVCIPKDVAIKSYAFMNCEKLKNINLENAISIGVFAFSSCKSIESLYLNCAVANNAFFNCTSLKKVILGEDFLCVNNGDIFKNCTNLEQIIVDKNIEELSLEYLNKEYKNIIEINSIDNIIQKNKTFT